MPLVVNLGALKDLAIPMHRKLGKSRWLTYQCMHAIALPSCVRYLPACRSTTSGILGAASLGLVSRKDREPIMAMFVQRFSQGPRDTPAS